MALHCRGVLADVCVRPGLPVLLAEAGALGEPWNLPQKASRLARSRSIEAWRRAISSGSLRTLFAHPAVVTLMATSKLKITIRDIGTSGLNCGPVCLIDAKRLSPLFRGGLADAIWASLGKNGNRKPRSGRHRSVCRNWRVALRRPTKVLLATGASAVTAPDARYCEGPVNLVWGEACHQARDQRDTPRGARAPLPALPVCLRRPNRPTAAAPDPGKKGASGVTAGVLATPCSGARI
jgi:hypothetical protein